MPDVRGEENVALAGFAAEDSRLELPLGGKVGLPYYTREPRTAPVYT
jgi:hypothetical protein